VRGILSGEEAHLVAAPRIVRTPEEVTAAWAKSKSQRQFLKKLGVTYNVGAAERFCNDAGLVYPAPHWGGFKEPKADKPVPPVEEPADRLRHEMEVEAAQAKAKDAAEKLAAAKHELRTQQEFLAAVLEVCTVDVPLPVFPPLRQDTHKPHRSVVIQISDWQGGQKVSLCDTGGNVYDWEIMLSRQARFFEGVVGSIRNVMRAYCIDGIVLAYTGDILEGYKVFAEQGYQLCRDAGAQVVEGAAAWASFEGSLMREFPGIPVRRFTVLGNHGVPEGRKGGAVTSTVNYEYIWVNLLEANTAALGIESQYATDGRLLFEVAGQSCLITHGDEIRGQMGIPFYGIRTAWMKHTQELDCLFRYWFFGHIHQTSMVTYGNGAALSCGDAVGYNNLTGKLRNPSSTPMQSVYFLSHERGLDEISYIHLIDKPLPEPDMGEPMGVDALAAAILRLKEAS
jgi:hypothetical protein